MLHDILFGVGIVLSLLLGVGTFGGDRTTALIGIALTLVITIMSVSYDKELHEQRMQSLGTRLKYMKIALAAFTGIKGTLDQIKEYKDNNQNPDQTIEAIQETVIKAEEEMTNELEKSSIQVFDEARDESGPEIRDPESD